MRMFGKKKIPELDELLEEIRMNSSNNYKDAAHEAYDLFWKRLEEMKQSGAITEKTYIFYSSKGSLWDAKMKNYNHQNNVKSF